MGTIVSQVERRQFLAGTIGSGFLVTFASLASKQSRAQDFTQNVEPTLQSATSTGALIRAWQDLLNESVVELKKTIIALNPPTLEGLTTAASDTLTRCDELLSAMFSERDARGLESNLEFNHVLTEIAVSYVREVSDVLTNSLVEIIGQLLGTQASENLGELFAVNHTLLGKVLTVTSKNPARRGGAQ
jgi:hypothetical protein